MKYAQRSHQILAGSMRAFVVGLLCVLMVNQPSLAAPPRVNKPSANDAAQIQGERSALHVLNRFTFGPRPGDLGAVEAMGVKRWFEQQLNPESIDDSALDARLAMFPAMQLSQAELMQRYPSSQMLRQIIAKDLPLPADPVEHAIYSDQIAFYQAAKARREAKAAASKEGASAADDGMQMDKPASADAMKNLAALPGDGVDPSTPAMETHVEQLYAGLDAVRIINLPPDQRMQRILGMQPDALIAFRKSLSRSELAAAGEGLTPEQKEILQALQGSPRMIDAELLESRMLRDIYSERQLQAVMTDFWLNHFNVYLRKNQNEPYLLPAYERDVIRPHALGKFENLLVATAESPAMLMYLDNWQSIGPHSIAAENAARNAQRAQNPQVKKALKDRGLNENYARELMELHTLGVQCEVSEDHPARSLDKACGKGYTQQDVIEVAKVLSGWTIDRPNQGAEFRFEERRHEPGTKVVMGKKIRENGQGEGRELLHMLATSPATARFISNELAVRFVSDTPPPALVARMAKAYVKSDGNIKTVLWTMFNSPEFWSPEVYRAKVKTPLEFVVSAVRASGAEVTNAAPLVQALNRLGMPLYGMQTPNGYSWMAQPWVNTGDLVSRMNFALVLTSNRLPGVQTDWTQLLDEPGGSIQPAALNTEGRDALIAEKEKKLEMLLVGQPASDPTRDTVLGQFENQETQAQAMKNFGIKPTEREIMSGVLNAGAPKRAQRPPLDRQSAGMAGLLIGSPEFQRR